MRRRGSITTGRDAVRPIPPAGAPVPPRPTPSIPLFPFAAAGVAEEEVEVAGPAVPLLALIAVVASEPATPAPAPAVPAEAEGEDGAVLGAVDADNNVPDVRPRCRQRSGTGRPTSCNGRLEQIRSRGRESKDDCGRRVRSYSNKDRQLQHRRTAV